MKHQFLRHLFTFFLLVSTAATAQQVTHLDKDEIIRGGDVSCLLQDHTGYLWMGTHNGLMCYDGYSIMQNGGEFNDIGHYHLHIFPRFKGDGFGWTSGEGKKSCGKEVAAKLRSAIER